MSNLNTTIKNFTPKEYRGLSVEEINEMMDNNIPFKVSSLFYLEHGFSFCPGTETLYKNDEIIKLTRLEKKFLSFLISKPNTVIHTETIKDIVWENKETTIYTIRNIVNKIRSKSYYEIIRNKSNCGYVIWQQK